MKNISNSKTTPSMVFKVKDSTIYNENFYREQYELLNTIQKEKVDKLKDQKDKNLSLLGLHLASKLLDAPIKEIYYEDGRPMVKNAYLSITHKYPYVGVIVSHKPIGIDIETLREIDMTTIKYLQSENSLDALIKWTRKESLFKSGLEKNYRFKTIIIDKKIIMTISEEIE